LGKSRGDRSGAHGSSLRWVSESLGITHPDANVSTGVTGSNDCATPVTAPKGELLLTKTVAAHSTVSALRTSELICKCLPKLGLDHPDAIYAFLPAAKNRFFQFRAYRPSEDRGVGCLLPSQGAIAEARWSDALLHHGTTATWTLVDNANGPVRFIVVRFRHPITASFFEEAVYVSSVSVKQSATISIGALRSERMKHLFTFLFGQPGFNDFDQPGEAKTRSVSPVLSIGEFPGIAGLASVLRCFHFRSDGAATYAGGASGKGAGFQKFFSSGHDGKLSKRFVCDGMEPNINMGMFNLEYRPIRQTLHGAAVPWFGIRRFRIEARFDALMN
jgi:hypothetical protein